MALEKELYNYIFNSIDKANILTDDAFSAMKASMPLLPKLKDVRKRFIFIPNTNGDNIAAFNITKKVKGKNILISIFSSDIDINDIKEICNTLLSSVENAKDAFNILENKYKDSEVDVTLAISTKFNNINISITMGYDHNIVNMIDVFCVVIGFIVCMYTLNLAHIKSYYESKLKKCKDKQTELKYSNHLSIIDSNIYEWDEFSNDIIDATIDFKNKADNL